MSLRSLVLPVVTSLALGSCSDDGATPASEAGAEPATCEECLAAGGTWQPAPAECTEDCNVADTSCYRDACPAPCAPDSCGTCEGETACEAAGCTWVAEAEASFCRE